MSKVYPGMHNLRGHMLAAVDVETTGKRAGYHEIIQIAVVPLNEDIRPMDGVRPFYTNIAPMFDRRADPGAMTVNKLSLTDLLINSPDQGKVQELLLEWWHKLDLPVGKCLVPLAHNWAFESSFLRAWLGVELAEEVFHSHARDAMLTALWINDRASWHGDPPPYTSVKLGNLCKYYKVTNSNPHDALSDAIAEAEVYRAMMCSNM